jgi:hypothetical protein
MSVSPFGRLHPVTWLLLQGAATVASILLAFLIDAWWDQRREVAEKNEMLEYVKTAMLSDAKEVTKECAFRRASLDNVRVLLTAVAAGSYADNMSLLSRLADLTWYSVPRFSTGPLASLLSTGRAAVIRNAELRAALADFPREVDQITEFGARDQATLLEDIAPFLGRNTDFLAINNESYRHGRPGDGLGSDPSLAIPAAEATSQRQLLGQPEFTLVLIEKMWVDVNMRDYLCGEMARHIDRNLELIDEEINEAS